MRAVNLLHDDGHRQEGGQGLLSTTSIVIGGGGLLVVIWVVLGFLFVQSHNTVSDKRETLKVLQQQVAEAEAKKAAALAASTTTPSSDQARLTAFQTAASARIAWDTLLGDVAKVMPAGSWLASLTMHMPTPPVVTPVATDPNSTSTVVTTNGLASAAPVAPVADPTTFVITGFAVSNHVIAKVMDQLERVPMLSNVSLQGSQESDIGAHKAFHFSMNAVLNFAPTGPGADQ
jgi:Tfp pilus assembly protein PilN